MEEKYSETSNQSLNQVIVELTGSKPDPRKLVSTTKLSRSTVNDALKRPIVKTSFGVATKILKANKISLDTVAEHISNKRLNPKEEGLNFIRETSLDDLTIMGVKFSSKENYWTARDNIMNNIYEGFHPSKQSVINSYELLEKHVPVDQLVSDLLKEYREN
ncbi:hypothetical protein [Companilactobacillus ginsenosidimutans]|uniref:hypothetical protein n=1 Tax=Companilactobacillus ginsenosidimutans TaxID=1007676 RepID=UPI00069E278D|nr:hypothetical protein [Companilactobacillus ginsenosidimutans]